MGKADLHIHTNASDGVCEPETILERAVEKGLKTIAITDHDSIKGFKKARERNADGKIELLPGVELSVRWKKKEIHLLAYCFNPDSSSVNDLMLRQSRARRLRMAKIVDHLKKQGVDIDLDEVKAEAGFSNIGRPHAASVLINKGIVASPGEAFIRYLSSEQLGTIDTEYCTLQEAIELMKSAGGVLSLAHPGPLYSSAEVYEMMELGIDAIECIHPSHPWPVQKNFVKLAKKNNFLITGGSDYHGKRESDYDPYFGIVTLGEQHVAALKRVSKQRLKLNE